jgi:hypothetical protein
VVCHSGLDPESSVFPGFLLEFIPKKIGAGMTSFSVINVVAYRPLRGIEKKYVSEFMNQRTKSFLPHTGHLGGSTELL